MLLLAACSPSGPGAPSPPPASSNGLATPADDPCHRVGVIYCVLNPDVTPATIRSTICVAGWTSTVRPPADYTSGLKQEQIQAEGLPGTAADYEEDHRMPLELGGAPRDPFNLSPEARSGTPRNAALKDAAEDRARRQVCDAGAGLRQVQAAFVEQWLAPYPGYT